MRIALLLLFALQAFGAGVKPEDYYSFEFAGDPHLSPDGRQVAYVVTTIDQAKNRRESALWAVRTDGQTPPRKLTAKGVSSNSPRWSPDGSRLAFISNRDGAAAQIWVLPLDGGEAQPLTQLKSGIAAFQWSPDGKRIVATSRTGPTDDIPLASRKSDVRHYSHILYKFNDTGWYDDKRSHIWVIDAVSGGAKQITSGEDWNDADPQWSPDSKKIAFVSDRSGKEFDDERNKDIWVIPADGGELLKISDHAHDDTMPRWSPDGTKIAFAGEEKVRQFPKLYVAPATGGPSQMVMQDLDLIPGDLRWGPGAGELRFETGYKGQNHMFRIDTGAKKLTQVTSGERAIHNVDAPRGAAWMVYLANDARHMDDVFLSTPDGKDEKQLTHLNAKLWAGLDLVGVDRVAYKSTDGWDIDGFFMKPVGWEAGKTYPMIVSIHGGPAGQYGTDWDHEFQGYAAKGYAVFFCNPRGSTGYGEKFERGIVSNWGGMDYQDVMAGVDATLKKYPWVDANKLGVTGGSYGGYLTNWIVGHTNRFKAAVTLRGISNFISVDGTRDGAYGHAEDFKDFLFNDFEEYWNDSPLKYAKNVKTPILILHSDNDYRVPLEQGEQWFRALRRYGVNAEIVMFPRENHNLTRTGEPKHLVESLNWQLYWFDKYLNGNAGAKAPDAN
jgi:dipeptidyl aminopeptidase/acylaminoacyl peptidase